jgi:hypothetical protein
MHALKVQYELHAQVDFKMGAGQGNDNYIQE